MKIDKNKFNKLKQLDRIEYSQKEKFIQEKYQLTFSFLFMASMIIIGLLCILISLNMYQMDGETSALNLYEASYFIFNLTFFYLIFEIILNFVNGFIKEKKIRELNEEYFLIKIEVKKK